MLPWLMSLAHAEQLLDLQVVVIAGTGLSTLVGERSQSRGVNLRRGVVQQKLEHSSVCLSGPPLLMLVLRLGHLSLSPSLPLSCFSLILPDSPLPPSLPVPEH